MRDAQTLLERMESATNVWGELPDGHPSGDSICHLIENRDSPAVTNKRAISETA